MSGSLGIPNLYPNELKFKISFSFWDFPKISFMICFNWCTESLEVSII